MASTKTVALNLRISPEKKAALVAMAITQRVDVTKLVLPQIDLLLQEGRGLPQALPVANNEGQGDDLAIAGNINFWPLPGDERFIKHYAAARSLTTSTVMRLILRSWRTKNPALPKNELSLLAVTSNQLAAIGRNLNQLVKLAHTGVSPQQDTVIDLIDQAREEMRHASETIDDIVRTNQTSWESDYA
ncbi:MAG: plasmid mobilization relaxosome protein MobC [Methyloglobulus sp.]|nr:plasmid mobilization relaxosome protein MobC [Methyloglobulus sp.]